MFIHIRLKHTSLMRVQLVKRMPEQTHESSSPYNSAIRSGSPAFTRPCVVRCVRATTGMA